MNTVVAVGYRSGERTAVAPNSIDAVLSSPATRPVISPWQLVGDEMCTLGDRTGNYAAPITAVALSSDGRRLAAVTGDRGGALGVTPDRGTSACHARATAIMLSSTTLAVVFLDDREMRVWCRCGALALTWT